jgi:hypothetical protein
MNMLRKKRILHSISIFCVLILFVLVVFVSCKHAPVAKPSCTNKFNELVEMKWGTYFMKTDVFYGYKLNTKSELIKYWFDTTTKATIEKKVDNIDSVQYCNSISQFKNLIVKYQVLNIPADTVNYLEYFDPSKKISIRFLWNPNNKTYANRGVMDFYESLEEIVKNYDK